MSAKRLSCSYGASLCLCLKSEGLKTLTAAGLVVSAAVLTFPFFPKFEED